MLAATAENLEVTVGAMPGRPLRRAAHGIRALHQRYPSGFPQRKAHASLALTPIERAAIGRSGVGRSSHGLPSLEDNPRLHPYYARGLHDDHGVYHEMARGDGAIAGTLAILYREIVRAHYRISLPPDATAQEREAGEFVEAMLGLGSARWGYGWISGGFRRLLFHALQSFVYGFSALEVTWTLRPWRGRTVLAPAGAAWRAPWSVDRWVWRGDDVVGMSQQTREGLLTKRRIIPADALLLFTNGHLDGNPEGTSMLRPAFSAWRAKKDTILRYQIAEDALFGGVVLLETLPDNEGNAMASATKEDDDEFREVFQLWRDRALDWLEVPFGKKVSEHHPEFSIPSRVEELKYYDHQIFLTGLAALLGLDASHSASKALSDGLGAVMYNAIDGAARSLCEVINGIEGVPSSGLIRAAVDANFATTPEWRYPRLEPHGIEHADLAAYVDAISKASQMRLASITVDDELAFRELAGMLIPDRDELVALRALLMGHGGDATQISQAGTQAPIVPPVESAGDGSSSGGNDSGDAPAATGTTDDIQKENLNGAQATALQALLFAVAKGELPVEGSIILVRRAFPVFGEDEARRMVEDAAAFAKGLADAAPENVPAPAAPNDDEDEVPDAE